MLQHNLMSHTKAKITVVYANKEKFSHKRKRPRQPRRILRRRLGLEALWRRGVARIGSFYGLSALEALHLGTDGTGAKAEAPASLNTKGRGQRSGRQSEDVRILCSEGCVGKAPEVSAGQPNPRGKVTEFASRIARNASSSACRNPPSASWRATTPPSTRRNSRSAIAVARELVVHGVAARGQDIGHGATRPAAKKSSAGSEYASPSGHLVRPAFDDCDFCDWTRQRVRVLGPH